MSVSYNKLWKLLIDKKMNKTDLRLAIGASTATMAKLSKEDEVAMDTLARICHVLHCNVGDIMDFVEGGSSSSIQIKSSQKPLHRKGGKK